MKYLKKIFDNLITDFYKIEILRTFIVLFRFIFLYYILKKIKFYIPEQQKIKQHITIKKRDKDFTVISHNMHFVENFFNLKETFNKFNGSKTVSLTYPLKSVDYLNFENSKILSVGPRNEGELYLLRSLGFSWKNIYAIDLLSYSRKIELGDIHKTNYKDETFDIIVCGWVLSYSNDYEKILDEMLRISKKKGIISIGFTYIPEKIDEQREYDDRKKNILDSTDQILSRYKNKISNVYFEFDAMKFDKSQKRHSILILRLKKD